MGHLSLGCVRSVFLLLCIEEDQEKSSLWRRRRRSDEDFEFDEDDDLNVSSSLSLLLSFPIRGM